MSKRLNVKKTRVESPLVDIPLPTNDFFLAESLLKCTSGTYIPNKLELFNVLIGLCANVADAPRIQIVNTLKKIEETEA